MLARLEKESFKWGSSVPGRRCRAMFSVPDIAVASILALLLFGPDQLPKMMRQFGRVMREVQNTSHSFIAEMERAADAADLAAPSPVVPPAASPPAAAPGPVTPPEPRAEGPATN